MRILIVPLISIVVTLGFIALWLTGLLAVGLIAALQSTAASLLMTSGSIITRDFYKAYVNQNMSWEKERRAARIIMMLIFLASLYLATFAKPAMIIFSGIAISIAFQFIIVLLGLVWFPWITRGAAIFGLIIGIIIVNKFFSIKELPWVLFMSTTTLATLQMVHEKMLKIYLTKFLLKPFTIAFVISILLAYFYSPW